MLGQRGLLTVDEERFRRTTNAWYDATYVNPASVDPGVYDPDVNPLAASWFAATAEFLLEPIPGYLAILAAHNVPCERYTSSDPGRIVYQDPHQVVVVPYASDVPGRATASLWMPPVPGS